MQYTEDATSTYILNECEAIKIGLDSLEPSFQHASKHSESLLNNTASTLRSLEARFNVVLSNPESKTPKNEPQVSLVKRRLKEAHLECLKVESSLRKRLQADVARRYGIANPDATETQIKEAVEDLDVSILNQNLLKPKDHELVRSALNNTGERHLEVESIHSQMVELGEIFRELDTIVQRQGVFVTAIEHDGEITHKNVEEANTQIARANENARSRNRTKWWCLLISLLVVAAVALVVALVTRP